MRAARRASERGSAMVMAIMVTLMMLAMVLATFAVVEGQQRAGADERIRDSSYNLTDSALDSVVSYMTIAQEFPEAANPYGDANGDCGPDSTSGNCPDPAMVQSAFSAASGHRDYGTTPVWKTTVRDNNQPTETYYRETGPPNDRTGRDPDDGTVLNYDDDGDGRVWVRAEGIAQGRKRTLIALVERRTTSTPAPYPSTGLFAEDIGVPFASARLFVDMQGDSEVPGRLDLACHNAAIPSHLNPSPACPQADATKGQIVPWTVSTTQNTNLCIDHFGNQHANTIVGPFCWHENTGAKVQELRARAQAAGTYYGAVCPTPAQLAGDVVFIDGSVFCSYSSGSNTWNSPDNPGMIVLGTYAAHAACSTQPSGVCFNIGGDNTYYGMIYDGNTMPRNFNQWGVGITGNARVFGVIITEFMSKIAITSTQSPAFTYLPKAWENFSQAPPSSGSSTEVKITPGTFREIPSTAGA